MASVGATLRAAREERALSIDQVSHDTRISARFLDALEADNYEALPAPVYVRGFLRSYASYLRLDPAPLLERLASSGALEEPGFQGSGVATRTIPPRTDRPRTPTPFERAAQIGGETPEERPAPRTDPFRRTMPPAPRQQAQTEEIGLVRQSPQRGSLDQTLPPASARAPGRPAPPPLIPPDVRAVESDAYVRSRANAVFEEPPDDEPASGGRILAMAAGGLLVLLAALGLAVLIISRGGDDAPAASPAATATPTVGRGTVVVVGSRTATTAANATLPAATATTTPDPNATPTATPGAGTPTATPTVQPLPTSTPRPGQTPTPAATPTESPSPTPTATPVATNTPAPPTPRPTATPTIAHASRFNECTQGGTNCGQGPWRVICPSDGDWFVDNGNDFGPIPPGWREFPVSRLIDATTVCG